MTKEMVIEWHDLIEDPNDLPHIDEDKIFSDEVFVQIKFGHQFHASYCRLKDADEGTWYDRYRMVELIKDDIVAWTCLPKYYNKEKRIDELLLKLPVGMVFHRIKKTNTTNTTNVYPKPGDSVIVFKYDESKDRIVSAAGCYDNKKWMEITRYTNGPINNVIGWSPFFKVNDNVTDSDEKE